MRTANEITAELVSNLDNELAYSNPQENIEETGEVILPIFWSEDVKGNINYDISTMREQFESLMFAFNEHNNNSYFDVAINKSRIFTV